jgi:cyclopropane fatty-acyl-phospholipid synthase-like methyltransferase
MSTLLAARDPMVSQVVGVDIFPGAMEAARRYARFAELDHKVVYIAHDFTLECDQLEPESFDGVISFHTLEHIYPEDLDAFVVNIRRILMPGGKVLICIPHKCAFDSPEHVSYFSTHALHALFVKHGFDVLELHVTDSGVADHVLWKTAVLTGLFIKPLLKGEEDAAKK